MTIRWKVLIIFMVLFLLVLGVGSYIMWNLGQTDKFLKNNVPQAITAVNDASYLDNIAQLIRYDDEVLTQSARNYAFTGDIKWKTRYEEYAPKLDLRIKQAIEKGDAEDKQFFTEIDQSNVALVDMEVRSLKLTDEGNNKEAQTILDSTEYWDQKAIYKDGLDKYLAKRGTAADQAAALSTSTLNNDNVRAQKMMTLSGTLLGAFITTLVLILVLLYLIFYYAIVAPLSKLKEATEKISQGNLNQHLEIKNKDEIGLLANSFNQMTDDLKESRANIEQKVIDRTKDLAEQKAKNESMLASIGDGVLAVDHEEKIILINPQAENLLGFKKDELLGRSLTQTIPMVDENNKTIPDADRPLKEALKDKSRHTRQDLYYVRKDKTKFPIVVTTASIVSNGEIIGAINVFRDITHEKQIDKAKTEFVSLASHQLRTPLSAINWYAEMLINGDVGKLTEEQLKYMGEIYKGNQRMVDLVNALLDVSRIELGTFAIAPKKIKIQEVAQDIVKEVRLEAQKKKIEIKENYGKDLPEILADPKLVQIIFQNLLSNAVKYTPEKGKVSLTITRKTPNILIEVKDTGYGIPKAQQPQIFEKLFRADNVREKDTKGTGLGLYIVKAIVDQSKGKVWFESAENKGTTFFVEIPLKGMPKKEGTKALEDIK